MKKTRKTLIPRSDLPILSELVETLSVKEVARKWDVSHDYLHHFLKSNGISVNRVRFEFRKKYVLENPHDTTYDLEAVFNCGYNTVNNFFKKLNKRG